MLMIAVMQAQAAHTILNFVFVFRLQYAGIGYLLDIVWVIVVTVIVAG